jgi:hypothetical protein
MSNKLKKVEEQKVPVKETRKDALRRLFTQNGLVEEDVHKDPRGFVFIKRSGVDKIVRKQGITIAYEVIKLDLEKDNIDVVLKAVASMKGKNGDAINMMSFGEASNANLMGGAKNFPVAMAEKRAMARVVLKMTGFYEQDKVFGEGEFAE